MLAVLVVLRKFWYFPNWRGTQLTFQSFRFNFVTGQNTQTIRRICMYGKTSPKAHISRHALIESDGRRMEEPTPSNSPRPRAMYNHLLQTGSCHCFAHHHHHHLLHNNDNNHHHHHYHVRPLKMRWNVFWVSKSQISMKKMGQNFHTCLWSGPGGWPPLPP